MERLRIEMEENGYGIFDNQAQVFLFEGILDWGVAWELHEMLLGETDEETAAWETRH